MDLLIVDDHLINLKLLRAQLESEGHVVFEAHDGVDAFALLERQHVDVVISDILMPRMDGYSLCYEIRKHTRLCDLPIIIYSPTYLSPGDENLALDMGADKFPKKPVSVATIVAALHEIVAQPHAAPRPDELREVETLKNYNERLVSKLKEKNTELQAQTEVLRDSEERFRTLVETAPDAIFIQTNRRFAYVNAAALRLFGATRPEELLGQPVLDRFHPDFRALVGERIRLLNEDRQPVTSVDEVCLTLAGSPKDVNISAVPFTYQNQNGALVFTRDITGRKRAEESIARERHPLRTLVDVLPETFYVKDLDSRFLVVNETVAKQYGKNTPAQLLGLSDVDLYPAGLAAEFRAEEMKVFAGEPLISHEDSMVFPDGRMHTVLTTKLPFRDSQGRICGLVGIGHDITERKQAEEQINLQLSALAAAANTIAITDPTAKME